MTAQVNDLQFDCRCLSMYEFCYNFIAPGSYMPEKVNLDHSPAFTFGQKIIQKTINDTPGKK